MRSAMAPRRVRALAPDMAARWAFRRTHSSPRWAAGDGHLRIGNEVHDHRTQVTGQLENVARVREQHLRPALCPGQIRDHPQAGPVEDDRRLAELVEGAPVTLQQHRGIGIYTDAVPPLAEGPPNLGEGQDA